MTTLVRSARPYSHRPRVALRGPAFAGWLLLGLAGSCGRGSEAASHPGKADRVTPPPGMVWIEGGSFSMGSSDPAAAADERPRHPVRVTGFFLDAREVTVAEFARFVEATGYVTTAERLAERSTEAPGVGSAVFRPPAGANIATDNWRSWWRLLPGADWRHPEGPGSSVEGRGQLPVVHVSRVDALAYAEWRGKRLPTEAEWEYAARRGRAADADLAAPPEPCCANIWQGEFPQRDSGEDGFRAPAPVGSFPADQNGVHDLAGNVWEWCQDRYDPRAYIERFAAGVATDPVTAADGVPDPEYVLRGGSFLCSDRYCTGYRPTARMHASAESGFSHVGFRCAVSR